METIQIDLWWQSLPQNIKGGLSEYGLTENVWQRADYSTKENFRKLYLLNPKPLMGSENRSLVIEVISELSDIILIENNNLPMEYMCNAEGEFFEPYQEEFNRIYDQLESVILEYLK